MKTKDQRGFAHNIALVILGLFVFATVGFAGFRVYESKNSDTASAAGFTTIKSSYHYQFSNTWLTVNGATGYNLQPGTYRVCANGTLTNGDRAATFNLRMINFSSGSASSLVTAPKGRVNVCSSTFSYQNTSSLAPQVNVSGINTSVASNGFSGTVSLQRYSTSIY